MISTPKPKPPAAAMNQVLIVGGSLNGLTMALLLANFGVRCVLVERRLETARLWRHATRWQIVSGHCSRNLLPAQTRW